MRARSSESSVSSATAWSGSISSFFRLEMRVGQQPRRVPLDVQAHVLGDHHQQPPRIVGVVDREVGVQPRQQRRLVAQNPHAGGVERRHPHVAGPRADQLRHPFAHLGGGLVGEGDRQDLPDADVAGGQQVGDAPGQHRGLARARAGDDQQRRTLVQHGLALLRVEPVEQLIGFGRLSGHSRDAHIVPKPTAASRHRGALPKQTLCLARRLVAHSIRAQCAVAIFLRVPASGARGVAASQSPAVRFRIRGSSVV